MSLIDQIIKGKRITADFLYDLAYGLANGDLATTNNNLPFWRGYDVKDHVMTGCVWSGDSYASTRYASMTSGVVCIGGKVVAVDSVANRLFTASKDTYIDVDNTGALYYSEVANNAASPTLSSGRLRIAVIVTSGTAIASQYSINQGQIANNTSVVRLNWSSGKSLTVDSLGNPICPRDPRQTLACGVTRAGVATTGSPGATPVAWNGLNYMVFYAEPNTNYEFVMHEPALSGAAGNDNLKFILYLSSTAGAYTTLMNESNYYKVAGNAGVDLAIPFNSGAYSGETYLEINFSNTGFTGTMTMNSDSARGAIYTIKKT